MISKTSIWIESIYTSNMSNVGKALSSTYIDRLSDDYKFSHIGLKGVSTVGSIYIEMSMIGVINKINLRISKIGSYI